MGRGVYSSPTSPREHPLGLSTSGGSPHTVRVLGRLQDTAVAKDWEGHEVLDDPNWSIAKNDAWVKSGVDSKQNKAGYKRVGDHMVHPDNLSGFSP